MDERNHQPAPATPSNVVQFPVAMKRGPKARTGPCAVISAFPVGRALEARARASFRDMMAASTTTDIRAAAARLKAERAACEEVRAAESSGMNHRVNALVAMLERALADPRGEPDERLAQSLRQYLQRRGGDSA